MNEVKQISNKGELGLILVKTIRPVDFITFDLDVLVPEAAYTQTIHLFEQQGFLVQDHPGKNTQGLHQKNLRKVGLLNVDLHKKFWMGIRHVNESEILQTKTKSNFFGLRQQSLGLN